MEVTVEEDVSGVLGLPHHDFGGEVLWTYFHWRTLPLSIQVKSREGASIVSNYHAIRVQHWYHFEHKVISQISGSFIVWNEVLECSVHYVRGISFSRMDAPCQNDSSSQCYLLGSAEEVSYDYHLAIIACQRLGQHSFPDLVFSLISAQSLKQLATVRVRVRIVIAHVDLVIVILEGNLKGQCIVWSTAFALDCVLVVADVFAGAVPADTTRFGSILARVEQRLLTLVELTVRLVHIDYVKFVPSIFLNVTDFEVEPLCMGCSAYVIFQEKIVGVFAYQESSSQVSRFKATLKL